MKSFLQGLTMGLAYVAPIGLQNLFVINSALTHTRKCALLTALIVIFFDVTLALACFFGVGAALCLLTLHLADIDSFGVDYTAPLSDGEPSPLRRLLLQKPKPLNKFRDPHLKTPDKRRQK